MDKENTYYSLIEGLVKKHKKFPGYEAILEDIIDDVYAHSEVIIKSIDNKSVVMSYLEKVISTSIITVPKKMNFNVAVNHRVIPANSHENVSLISVSKEESNPEKQTVEDSTIDEFLTTDNTADNIGSDESELFIDSEDELSVADDSISDIQSGSEVSAEDLEEFATDTNFSAQNYGDEKANPDLVDKMINSMGNYNFEVPLDTMEEQTLPDETVELNDLSDVDELEIINVDSHEESEDGVVELSEENEQESVTNFDEYSDSNEELPLDVQFSEADELYLDENVSDQLGEMTLELSEESINESENKVIDDVKAETFSLSHYDETDDRANNDSAEVLSFDESVSENNEEGLEDVSDDTVEILDDTASDVISEQHNQNEDEQTDKAPAELQKVADETDVLTETENNNDEIVSDEDVLILEPTDDVQSVSEEISDDSEVLSLSAEQEENFVPDLLSEDESYNILPEQDMVQSDMSDDIQPDNLEYDESFVKLEMTESDNLSEESEIVELSLESESLEETDEIVELSSEPEFLEEPSFSEPYNVEQLDNGDETFELVEQDSGFSSIDNEDSELSLTFGDGDEQETEESPSTDIQEIFDNDNDNDDDDDEITEHSNEYFDDSLASSLNLKEKKVLEYKPADFSVFNFLPEKLQFELNPDLITDKLLQLNQNYPELAVLKIFNMKYKQSMTVSEIAAELNISNKQVITTLNNIAKLV